jgi:hypothetical protein
VMDALVLTLIFQLCTDTCAKRALAFLTPVAAVVAAAPLFIAVRAFPLSSFCIQLVVQALFTDRLLVCKVIMPLEARLLTGSTRLRGRCEVRAEQTLEGDKSIVELVAVEGKSCAVLAVVAIFPLFHVVDVVVVATEGTGVHLVGVLHLVVVTVDLGRACHLAVDMICIILITSACYSLRASLSSIFFKLNQKYFFSFQCYCSLSSYMVLI